MANANTAVVLAVRCAMLVSVVVLTGCALGYHPDSPDVRYSKQASKSAALQVPPDLTDISEGAQFILPGTTGAAATRDTLLPQFSSAKYQRNEQQSWLEVAAAAEEVWPLLLDFLRSERLPIARTEPATGLIISQWQPSGDDASSEDAYRRVAFRLERAGSGTRIFARSQLASKATATQEDANAEAWPVQSSHPEVSNLILQRLLVFVGLEEQKANGLLSEQAARDVLNAATLDIDAGRSELLLHQSYRPALDTLVSTLRAIGFGLDGNSGDGSIRVVDSGNVISADTSAFTLRVEPVHQSAVKVSVLDGNGDPAQLVDARKLLGMLQLRLARTGIV